MTTEDSATTSGPEPGAAARSPESEQRRSTTRTRLSVDERRSQLLELGLELFGSRLYKDISIDDIASSAGISKGLLYHYFPSKRAFYLATLTAATAILKQSIYETESNLPPIDRLKAGLHAYLDFCEEYGEAYRTLIRSIVWSDGEVREIIDGARHEIVDRVYRDLRLRRESEIFRFAMHTWIGHVEFTSLEWLGRTEPSREVVVDMLVSSLSGAVDTASRLDPDAGLPQGVAKLIRDAAGT